MNPGNGFAGGKRFEQVVIWLRYSLRIIDSAKEFFAFQYSYQVGACEIKKIY